MNGIILVPAFGGGKSGRDIPQHETRMHQHANKVGKKDVVSTFAFISRINKEEMCVFAVPGTWQSLSKFLREVLMS